MDQNRRRPTQGTTRSAATRTASQSAAARATQNRAGTAQRSGQSHPVQRKKPTAKKKKTKVRFQNKNLKYQLLIVAAVVLAVVICLVVFFRVNHIQVRNSGNTQAQTTQTETAETEQPQEAAPHAYYTADEIIAASGIEVGDNLLTISKESVAAKIMAELPYISEIQIRRILPGTVDIAVSEFDVAYAIEDNAGDWWLINREGKVLEKTVEAEANTHLTVKGLRISDPAPAKQIIPETSEDMAEQNAKKTSLIMILEQLEGYDFGKQIVSVDLTASYDIRLWYGTQFEIRIGNTEELAYKLAYLEGVLEKLKSYQSGVIDLSFTEDKTARFQPFSE